MGKGGYSRPLDRWAQNLQGQGGAGGQFAPVLGQDGGGGPVGDPAAADQGAQGRAAQGYGVQGAQRPGAPLVAHRQGQPAEPEAWRHRLGQRADEQHPFRSQGGERGVARQAEAAGIGAVEIVFHQDQVPPPGDLDDVAPPLPAHQPRGRVLGRQDIGEPRAALGCGPVKALGRQALAVHGRRDQAVVHQARQGLQAGEGRSLADHGLAGTGGYPQGHRHRLLGAGAADQPLGLELIPVMDLFQPGRAGLAVFGKAGRRRIGQARDRPRVLGRLRQGRGDAGGGGRQRRQAAGEVDRALGGGCVLAVAGDEAAAAHLANQKAAPLGFRIGAGHCADAQAQAEGQLALGRDAVSCGQGAGGDILAQGRHQPLINRLVALGHGRVPGCLHELYL